MDSDPTLPPFWKFTSLTKASLFVYLDKERPLSEPKWAKTGDVQGWLKDMFGGRFWVAGDAVGWEKKIEVYTPDPVSACLSFLLLSLPNSACVIRHLLFRACSKAGLQIPLLECRLSASAS